MYKRSRADSNRCTCRDLAVNLWYTVLFTCYSNSILESKRHTPAIGFCTFCFCFPAMPSKMFYNTLMLHFPHYNAWSRPIKSQKCPIKSIKQRLFSLILMLTNTHTVPGITTTYTKVNGFNTAKINPLNGCISVASEFFWNFDLKRPFSLKNNNFPRKLFSNAWIMPNAFTSLKSLKKWLRSVMYKSLDSEVRKRAQRDEVRLWDKVRRFYLAQDASPLG